MQRVNLFPFPHSLSISSLFPCHFLILHFLAARLPQFVQPCCVAKFTDLMFPISDLIRLCSGFGHLLPCNCYIFNKIGLFLQILLSTNHRPYLQVSLSCGSSVVAAWIVVLGNATVSKLRQIGLCQMQNNVGLCQMLNNEEHKLCVLINRA